METLYINLQAFYLLREMSGKLGLLDFFWRISGEYLPYILIILFILILIKKKDLLLKRYIFFIAFLSVIVSRGIVTELIRFMLPYKRPFVELSFTPLINHPATASFPSGHMALLFALVIPAFYLGKKFGIWFTIGCLLVGVARIVTGIHWPLDILGGIAIALLCSAFIQIILPLKLYSKNNITSQNS